MEDKVYVEKVAEKQRSVTPGTKRVNHSRFSRGNSS